MKVRISLVVLMAAMSVLSGCAAVGASIGYAITESASPGVRVAGTVLGGYIGMSLEQEHREAQYRRRIYEQERRAAAGSPRYQWRTSGRTRPYGGDDSYGGDWICSGNSLQSGRHHAPPGGVFSKIVWSKIDHHAGLRPRFCYPHLGKRSLFRGTLHS